MSQKIIASQLDLHLKMQKASHVAWNDGVPAGLEEQAVLLAEYLKHCHG
jgi:dephospho-CoA kinase